MTHPTEHVIGVPPAGEIEDAYEAHVRRLRERADAPRVCHVTLDEQHVKNLIALLAGVERLETLSAADRAGFQMIRGALGRALADAE